MRPIKTIIALALVAQMSGFLTTSVYGKTATSPASVPKDVNEETWNDLKEDVFGDQAINAKASWLTIDGPYRAHEAALVPISIKAVLPDSKRTIKKLTLIIDENPAPVAAVFDFKKPFKTLVMSTRIRINEYSFVRAIIQLDDDSLIMTKRYIKAAGGCSAPAMKDMDQKMAQLGKMKLKQFSSIVAANGKKQSVRRDVQFMVRHPNYSGLQMNQVTGYYIPAHFVNKIDLFEGDTPLMSIEGAISLSEDPTIRFQFDDNSAGAQPLKVIVKDTENKIFKKSWQLKAFSKKAS